MNGLSLTKVFVAAAFAFSMLAGQGIAQAQSDEKKGELSLKAVKLITGFALRTIPSEVKEPDGTVLKIDKSDLSKLIVPLEDARRIIKIARLSAHAQICELPQLQAQNYLAMMREEQSKNKWSKQQLLFINRLHLFTVMWLTGNVKFVEKDGEKEAKVIADPDDSKRQTCSEEDRNRVRAEIEQYLKTAKKS